jgi:hypothetical protein
MAGPAFTIDGKVVPGTDAHDWLGQVGRREPVLLPATTPIETSLSPEGQWDKARLSDTEIRICTRSSGETRCGNIWEGWSLRLRRYEVWRRGSLRWRGSDADTRRDCASAGRGRPRE